MEEALQGRARNGWQETETARLFEAVGQAAQEGHALRQVFEQLSGELGRKPNSIRNYYYARLRQHPEASVPRVATFQAFTAEETRELLRQVLMARGEGQSVRSCVMRLAEGNHSRMLRYQNKYRTLVRRCPELVEEICEELRDEGLPCPEQAMPNQETLIQPDNVAMASLLAEPAVQQLLSGLKELLRRASRETEAPSLQRQVDRMAVQQDLRRLAWERDFDDCTAHLQRMMSLLRDFLALPKESQALQLDTFRDAGVEEISQAENFLSRMGKR